MHSGQIIRIALFSVFVLLSTASSYVSSCEVGQTGHNDSMAKRDINSVLKTHEKELLAIPGVTGVYVGVLPDGKTPCLKVMVVRETEELKKRIPDFIEGYPVIIEESGIIRPLKN